ncbi:hypothetical protein UlMin_008351 [Ulmus minor]
MESSGDVDDQGSGWFEVKKKHRNSSKFSLQSWVGGFSGKNSLNPYTAHSQRCGANSIVNNQHVPSLDYGAKLNAECSMSSPSHVVNSGGTGSGIKSSEKVPQKDKPNVVHKINQGGQEDIGSVLHPESRVGAGIKFGDIGDDNLMVHSENEKDCKLVSCVCTNSQENQSGATAGDSFSHQVHPKTPMEQQSEENDKESNGRSVENAEKLIMDEEPVDQNTNASNCKVIHVEHVKQVNDVSLNNSTSSGTEAGIGVKVQEPIITPEVSDREMSEVSTLKGGSQEPVVITNYPDDDVPGISRESLLTASIGDHGVVLNSTIHDNMSNTQHINTLGECDTVESKERFRQRLWCFLFENLNRAVDELYLLCELECDMEQMKEAVLVLEEAASDFKNLNTRVEEFENLKRSSSQLNNGVPINLKTDHRRPHALSWEVRRMTTSAHKAEILSSSLEAFKKIQQERAVLRQANDAKILLSLESSDGLLKMSAITGETANGKDLTRDSSGEQHKTVSVSSSKSNSVLSGHIPPQASSSNVVTSKLPPRDNSTSGKNRREQPGSEAEKLLSKKTKISAEAVAEKNTKLSNHCKRQIPLSDNDKEREKRNSAHWKSMDAWKEKRDWEDILSSPYRVSSRVSHSPGMSRKSAERARTLHDKLMSPEKKKKTAMDLKRDAEEKHARAMRIRSELENERVQKLQRTSEKLNRVSEWQAVRNMKLREGMYARHQRSESRHEAFLARVVKRAGDESSKVNEVRFITSLNEENKKLMLRQKLHDSELRRAEKLQVIKSKQKEDMAREEAVLERRKLIEAEKLQRLAETQKRKEEAQVRREEERKASSAAREARALEQLRRKEERAKAQQEEAELLAQKLAERLSESEQRRKFYLEQIRERASMDFRDQSSPLLRRSIKEGQGRSTPTNNSEDNQASNFSGLGGSTLVTSNVTLQHSMKRRIKRIRQRLMALKYEFPEPPVVTENAGIGYRTTMGTARVKIGRWLQELQRLRQARKEGAASIGLITADIIKYLEGKDAELQASRQAGLLDFIASALPASHTSKPEACQVTIHLLKLLKVVLSVPANRSYFLAQNLLPPIIPMLSAALENYIKIAASLNLPGNTNSSSKTSAENFESISEVLDGFLWTVTTIIGHVNSDERQLQMRDGLLELLTAYQVIHRLRDLFALYDRPQVEGSPFPSSILLSIYLLVVLTSRPEANCLIDWESLHSEMLVGIGSQEAKLLESADARYFPLDHPSGDHKPPLPLLSGNKVVNLPDVPEDKPLDESCKINKPDISETFSMNTDREQTNSSVEVNKVNSVNPDVPNDSQNILNEDLVKSFKDEKSMVDIGGEQKKEYTLSLEQPVAFLLSAISETGLVSLPSLLTAVLLQANNRLSFEQGSYVLPSNFEEVATVVLKVLNNLALLDLKFLQRMLARTDLKMEFFHLMSFLLSHCNSKWKTASDQVGLLLLESLSLLGHFALFHTGNQAVLRWGKTPTILHKICDLPFVFFSDPELMPILASTLVAACYGCEQNKGVVQLEISTDMLLSLLKSCKNDMLGLRSNSNTDNFPATESSENQQNEIKKAHIDIPRPGRQYTRNSRLSLGKSSSGSGPKTGKLRSQKDYKATKGSEEMTLKQNLPASETSSMTLHCRLPLSFVEKAEHFFSSGIASTGDEV